MQAAVGSTGQLAQRASLDAFTRLAVAFERFRSDWHIAAINTDASEFNDAQVRRITSQFEKPKLRPLLAYVSISVKTAHPTLEQIASLVDVTDGNLSINSADAWGDLAKKHLAEPWRGLVRSIKSSTQQRLFFDTVVAVRNVAAHQSGQATQRLNDLLTQLGSSQNKALGRSERGVKASNVAKYLNVQAEGKRRVEIYHDRLRSLAESLRNP